MTTRRSRGEGGLYWSEARQRWIGSVDVGFDALGKRKVRRFSVRTKTEAKEKLRDLLRQVDQGLDVSRSRVTVADVVEGWLTHGLSGRSPSTVKTCRHLAETHIVPVLGKRKLADLKVQDIDRLLHSKRLTLSTATLGRVLAILRRAIRWAEARDLVGRNVAMLCSPPSGGWWRPPRRARLRRTSCWPC